MDNARKHHKSGPNTVEIVLPLYADHIETQRLGKSGGWGWRSLLLGLATFTTWLLLYHVPRHGHSSHLSEQWHTQASRNPAYLINATHGAVASDSKRCSDIGVAILKEGGSAVDAAIGTCFCVGVVNMFSSGIGGGGFMTVRIPVVSSNGQSEVFTIDFRETAPGLANTSMFLKHPALSRRGGLSVAVPGELRGLEEAHRRWGKLPWRRLVRPSVELARRLPIDRELGKRLPRFSDLVLRNPDWSSIFAPNGVLLREGDIIRWTNLSRTLETIAVEGATALYKGPIADSLVRKIRSTGGILSGADLENYTVKVDHALEGTYRGRKVYTTHAPTSGPVLLHMLNLLEKYSIVELDGLTAHRITEILKFGFASRTRISDPSYTNDTDRIDIVATKEFANQIALNITDDKTHPPEYYHPEYDVMTDHGTTHLSVIDGGGMAVSLTSTINLGFGSHILDPQTGIILNDEMDDFSTPGLTNGFGLRPSPYNYPEPGKRPLSSISPVIIENLDGSFFAAIGAAGGAHIFGSVFQVLINLDLGLDVSAAIEFGRLHDQLYPVKVEVEDVYPPKIIDELRDIGHNISVLDVNRVSSVVQAVVQKEGVIFAASDSRKNGIAAGY